MSDTEPHLHDDCIKASCTLQGIIRLCLVSRPRSSHYEGFEVTIFQRTVVNTECVATTLHVQHLVVQEALARPTDRGEARLNWRTPAESKQAVQHLSRKYSQMWLTEACHQAGARQFDVDENACCADTWHACFEAVRTVGAS